MTYVHHTHARHSAYRHRWETKTFFFFLLNFNKLSFYVRTKLRIRKLRFERYSKDPTCTPNKRIFYESMFAIEYREYVSSRANKVLTKRLFSLHGSTPIFSRVEKISIGSGFYKKKKKSKNPEFLVDKRQNAVPKNLGDGRGNVL